jgi:hypothetical protein
MRTDRRSIPGLVVIAALSLATVVGCSENSELSKAEENQMRNALDAGKGEFDLSKVPPEQRERVKAIMESQKKGPGASIPK